VTGESLTAIRCDRLVKMYPAPTGETQALRGVEAAFSFGTVSAVTGPSGSGKSSLLAILALQERPSAGSLELLGNDVTTLPSRRLNSLRRRNVAWVAQRPSDSLLPSLTVREQLAQVALRSGRDPDPDALARLGLDHRRDAHVHELSGGEQQRLAVLAATLAGTRVVVADEPTAELDDDSATLVLAELHACARAGACVVVSTHDDRVMASVDRTLALRHGVLSSEAHREGRSLVPIDSAGRLQLPPAALDLFPGSRVELVIDDGEVRLRPPSTEEAT
jgi:putative ABC transport system ATP-binding protein